MICIWQSLNRLPIAYNSGKFLMHDLKVLDQQYKIILVINKLCEKTLQEKVSWKRAGQRAYQTNELVGYTIEIVHQLGQRSVLDAYYAKEEFFILRIYKGEQHIMEVDNTTLAKEIGEFKAIALMEQLYHSAEKSATGAMIAMNAILEFLSKKEEE